MSLPPYERFMNDGFQHGSISPEVLQKALTQALGDFFPTMKRNQDPRAEFYACYQRVSAECDKEFIKKYDEDLSNALIFAGLFSAIASAFIIDAQSNLQENFNQTSAALLRILIQKIDNSTSPGIDLTLPEWSGPSPVIVHVQCVLYTSLAASLLAAFVAMLGKQWLNRYEQVEEKGSLIERSRKRQAKCDGIVTWRFRLVLESLPVMLQSAVLLLAYALSQYLWTINTTVASVVIGISALGVLFYSFVVIFGVISSSCPFQTPLSLVLRFLIHYEKKQQLFHAIPSYLRSVFYSISNITLRRSSRSRENPHRDVELNTTNLVQEVVVEGEGKVEPMFEPKPANLERIRDIPCASWLLKASTEADVTLATVCALLEVEEVEKHSETKITPTLGRLYDAVSESFDSTDDFLTPETRGKAYTAAKVFIRIYTRRCCLDHEQLISEELSLRTRKIPSCPEGDADLNSILEMVREIVEGGRNWAYYSSIPTGVSLSHLSWMAHILICRVWQSRKNTPYPDGIYNFTCHVLSPDFIRQALSSHIRNNTSSPEPLIADCLMAISITIGLPINSNDLFIGDKSGKMSIIIDRLYQQLEKSFRTSPSRDEMKCLISVLEIMNIDAVASQLASWSGSPDTNGSVASEGVIHPQERLFRAIMDPSRQNPDRWPAARLALQHIFRNGAFCPYFKDSMALVAFLEHHFVLDEKGEQHFDPIAAALQAFSSPFLCHPPGFNTTERILLDGMRKSLNSDRPTRVRLNALFFVEWIGCHDCDVLGAAISSSERSEFCSDLASIWNYLPPGSGFISCYFEILLRMANSYTWHTHLLPEQWRSLESLSTRCPHLLPLDRCLLDESLILSLSRMRHWDEIMKPWLRIVWRQSFEAFPASVIAKVCSTTLELFRREGQAAVEEFKALIHFDREGLLTLRYGAPDAQHTTRLESVRRRELILQELGDEVCRILSSDIVDSPISISLLID